MGDHVHDCTTCNGYWECGSDDCEEESGSCWQCRIKYLEAKLAAKEVMKPFADYVEAIDHPERLHRDDATVLVGLRRGQLTLKNITFGDFRRLMELSNEE